MGERKNITLSSKIELAGAITVDAEPMTSKPASRFALDLPVDTRWPDPFRWMIAYGRMCKRTRSSVSTMSLLFQSCFCSAWQRARDHIMVDVGSVGLPFTAIAETKWNGMNVWEGAASV